MIDRLALDDHFHKPERVNFIRILAAIISACVIFCFADTVFAREYLRLSGVMHVHTIFSSGKYSVEQLVNKAVEKNIDVIAVTDHDLVAMEYGLPPFRNLIKKRVERNSVLKNGIENYLGEINRVNNAQKEVIVIPGVQSSPFYYWTGLPFGGKLTAHDYRKELLLIGMRSIDDYNGLPVMHSGISARYTKESLPKSLVFLGALFMGIYLVFHKGLTRKAGIAILLCSLILLINHHPFQSSSFDQYHGDQGIAPFQELINYVREKNGLVFWAHPESRYSNKGVKIGPVTLMTKKYPGALLESKNYSGFSAIYGDSITATKPGMHWDQVLREYCSGKRGLPVWGISGADFHAEKPGVELDTFQTVFLVTGRNLKDVMDALSRGRFYALRKGPVTGLVLDRFRVNDIRQGLHSPEEAVMGEGLTVFGLPVVEGKITAADGGGHPVNVRLIRGGRVLETFKGRTPLEFHYVDKKALQGKTYYRVEVSCRPAGRLLSNPIFIRNAKRGV